MVSGKVTCRAGLGLFKTAPAQKASKLGDLSLGLELLVLWGLSLLLSHLCSEAARAGLLAAADPPPTGAALLRLCFSHGGGWRFPGLQASSGWHCGLPEEQEWEPSSPAALSLPGAEGGLGVFSRSPSSPPLAKCCLGELAGLAQWWLGQAARARLAPDAAEGSAGAEAVCCWKGFVQQGLLELPWQ